MVPPSPGSMRRANSTIPAPSDRAGRGSVPGRRGAAEVARERRPEPVLGTRGRRPGRRLRPAPPGFRSARRGRPGADTPVRSSRVLVHPSTAEAPYPQRVRMAAGVGERDSPIDSLDSQDRPRGSAPPPASSPRRSVGVGQGPHVQGHLQAHQGSVHVLGDCSPGCDDYGGIHSLNESDEKFTTEAVFNDLKIPKQGNPAPPGSPLSLKAGQLGRADPGELNLSETYWTQENPNAPVNCHAISSTRTRSRPTSSPRPRAPPRASTWTSRRVSSFEPSSVQGTNCDTAGADKWTRSTRRSSSRRRRLPPRHAHGAGRPAARKAPEAPRRRQSGAMSFHQDKAKRLPPGNLRELLPRRLHVRPVSAPARSVSVARTG